MKKMLSLLAILFCAIGNGADAASSFVRVQSGHFTKDGRAYFFVGANFWHGMNLGASGESGNRPQLLRELDLLEKNGVKQLRIMALSEGPSTAPYRVLPAVENTPGIMDENLLVGLDFLLAEMAKRKMTAVLCLSNFWPWSGGMSQWVSWSEGSSIPYPPPHPGGSWSRYQDYASRFYTLENAIAGQRESVRKLVSRVNTVTKKHYRDDATIMAWELANEPRGGKNRTAFLKWISASAKFIKSIDENHLVTLGSEGETLDPKDAGNDFLADHASPDIDYATFHVWVENWGVYDPLKSSSTLSSATEVMRQYFADHVLKSKLLGKPVVLEEFGMARDRRSMDPKSSTRDRDTYYNSVFELSLAAMTANENLAGIGFWAWSGESRPRLPYGSLWEPGDALLGDPPHEEQGWYGVYDSDRSTLGLVKHYADQMKSARFRLNRFKNSVR